jgi:hypothetical protein
MNSATQRASCSEQHLFLHNLPLHAALTGCCYWGTYTQAALHAQVTSARRKAFTSLQLLQVRRCCAVGTHCHCCAFHKRCMLRSCFQCCCCCSCRGCWRSPSRAASCLHASLASASLAQQPEST